MTNSTINYVAYSKMLEIQVDMCIPFEYGFYSKIKLNNFNIISEIGCGNGYFLNKVHSFFPLPTYIGYDHSTEMINLAKTNQSNKGVNFILGSVSDLKERTDIILLRLIMHHIPNRKDFIKQAIEKLNPGGMVLMIEPLDEKFQLFPQLQKFLIRLGNLRSFLSPNKSRELNRIVVKEMEDIGLTLVEENSYYMPSLLPGYKEKYKNYMHATNNILGNSEEAGDEIEYWYNNNSSYAQIGLFMHAFKKEAG